ncbi:MAG: alanine racemase [Gammaproteobacteria bacterium]|nr:alanine racemase [Gammaproteobacteria bacterium]
MRHKTTNNRPAHIVIDRAALRHNLRRVRELVPDSQIMAVIKADAYGHGMEVVASALYEADEFAVNSLDDARRLREHRVDKPVTLLSATLDRDELQSLGQMKVRPTIFDHSQLALYRQFNSATALSVWLKVDTGMGRLGFRPAELGGVLEQISQMSCVGDISLMTHLANADQPGNSLNLTQLDLFADLAQQYSFRQVSVLNSAGSIALADSAYDMVRPGLMLYGASPLIGVSAEQLNLKPVMTFKSQLISVKMLPRDNAVGYGSTYTLSDDTRVGIVACGYGDGYPRHAPSGTPVLVNGLPARLIGRVSMDMLALDLGDVESQVGDEVVLWGEGNPIENIAGAAETIAYELTCGITARVERIII